MLTSAEKFKNITFFVQKLIDQLCRSNHNKFQVLQFSTVLEQNEIIHQKFRHSSTFLRCQSAKFLVCKIELNIKRNSEQHFFVLHRHAVYQQLIKKAMFQGLMTRYSQSFEFKFQKGKILDKLLHIFTDVRRKCDFFYFFYIGQLRRSNRAKFQVI